jgi:hypothetical protein
VATVGFLPKRECRIFLRNGMTSWTYRSFFLVPGYWQFEVCPIPRKQYNYRLQASLLPSANMMNR